MITHGRARNKRGEIMQKKQNDKKSAFGKVRLKWLIFQPRGWLKGVTRVRSGVNEYKERHGEFMNSCNNGAFDCDDRPRIEIQGENEQ